MGIRVLDCPNCSAHLALDDSRDFAFCEYCGTKIMLKDKVEVSGKVAFDESDKYDQCCQALIAMGDYSGAMRTYYEYQVEYPGDWRCWWGGLEALHHTNPASDMKSYHDNFLRFAPPDVIAQKEPVFNRYLSEVPKAQAQAEFQKLVAARTKEQHDYIQTIGAIRRAADSTRDRMRDSGYMGYLILGIILLVCGVGYLLVVDYNIVSIFNYGTDLPGTFLAMSGPIVAVALWVIGIKVLKTAAHRLHDYRGYAKDLADDENRIRECTNKLQESYNTPVTYTSPDGAISLSQMVNVAAQ